MAQNLETDVTLEAPVGRVWEVVSDLRRMPQWSPQCRKVFARGPVRQGTHLLNLNSDGTLWWPTLTRVTDFSHRQRVAFRVPANGTEWSFTLVPEGERTRVIERRDVPANGTTRPSRWLIERFFGGEEAFEADLVTGMKSTLERLKADVESGAVTTP